MRAIRFFIFTIFNMAYKDGNNEQTDPYTYSVMIILVLEFFLALLVGFFLRYAVDFDIFDKLDVLCGNKYGFELAFLTLLGPANYYFFIKKKRLDIYYNELRYAEINTKRNRKIGYACLIIYAPITIGLSILFKCLS